ncbi:hypothetical protein Tco_0891864 [Tanacetum coccineum]|uniref:Uncharacterized protein n=1 Tax=Tanacetum coccineum TaxID=301880 RepID=A0ABQ5C797_9ASTR
MPPNISNKSSSTRSNASSKYKGKEIAKPITPPSESSSKEDSDLEQAQRDKDMQKLCTHCKLSKRNTMSSLNSVFLTKSHYEGLVKEKTKVITDLKLKEEKDIDKMISMEKQLMFLNEFVYKRNQSIQTIHMLSPKGSTFNGRPTFANPVYLKKAQSEKPCLYEIPYDTSDPAKRFRPPR